MDMTELLWFALATIGLTNIMVHGKILDVIGLRPWLREHMRPDYFQVFECYECSGFWAGLICGLFFLSPYHWWLLPICGFAGSAIAQTYTDVLYWLRSKTEFEVSDAEETTIG